MIEQVQRHAALIALASLAIACVGNRLDVSEATSAATTSPQTPEPRLIVDGVRCAVVDDRALSSRVWPSWAFAIDGDCGPAGGVNFILDSNATVPYPQACSVVTLIEAGFDSEGDGGALSYVADATRGDCSVTSGPTTSLPGTKLSFSARLTSAHDPSRTHDITFVAASGPPADFDASAGADASSKVGESSGYDAER